MHDHASMIAADGAFWAVLLAAMSAGLLSGFTHCVAMCGPFVLGQSAQRMAQGAVGMGELQRLRGAALLPYHLGRGTVYVGLGAAGGLMSSAIVQIDAFKVAAAVLLVIAGAMMIRPAFVGLGGSAGGGFYTRLVGPSIAGLARGNGYRLGLALGFLPCGMVYAALAAAASTGSMAGGAAIMAGFAAATIPGLVAVAFLGQLAGKRWRLAMARAAPWLMVVNGLVLLYLVARMFL